MPIINITGAGGRGPGNGGSGTGGPGNAGGGPSPARGPNGMRTGPTSQIPFMRPDYDAAFRSNQSGGQGGPDDYARALAQREAQERRAAAAERQKQTQQDSAFRKAEQQAAEARRVFERTAREETRAYESMQAAKARADAALQRVRDRNARAQEQLDRRKAADAERQARFQRSYEVGDARHIDSARTRGLNWERGYQVADARAIDMQRTRRIREEAQLGRQFENLRYRAGQPLTASSFAGIQRQASLLGGRAAAYQSQYGMSPAGLGGMGGVLSGMGTRDNTYATQNILGLGARGQRAADSREYVGLARIEQELRRIERVNVAMLANQKATSQQQANAQRNLNAVAMARGRIGAGRSGSSGLMNMAGNLIGGAGLLLSNPIVDAAVAGSVGLAMSPFLAASTAQKIQGLAAPYDALREGTAAVGRAGGFNSMDLQDQLFPGNRTPQWMKDMGVTTQGALGTLNAYGIAPTSSIEALGVVQDVRRASLSPYMGLDDQQLAGSGRLARTLGISGGGSLQDGDTYTTDLSKYFATLQKVMASATSQGLDHASSLKTVEGLLRMTAGSGAASVNTGVLSNFWGQMTSSGLPGMRSGEGVASALEGINKSFGSIGVGGAPMQNTMMMTYFAKHGGMPQSEGALQKFLGKTDEEWANDQQTPGHRQMVQNYLNAAGKNPAIALNYLSPFLQGRPDLAKTIFEGSSLGDLNPLIKPLVGGIATGAGYPGYVAMTSGRPTLPGAGGTAPLPTAEVGDAIRAAAHATGVPEYVLKGLAAKESSMDPLAVPIDPKTGKPLSSAAGLFQITKDARTDTGLREEDKFKPQENALAGAEYLKKMYALFPADDPARTMHAYEAYEWGPGHADAIKAGNVPEAYRQHAQTAMDYAAQYANMPSDQYASRANTETLSLTAGKDARENAANLIGQAPGDDLVAFSASVVQGTTAVENFVRALIDGTNTIKYRNMVSQTPGGTSPMDPTGGGYLFAFPTSPGGAGPARP